MDTTNPVNLAPVVNLWPPSPRSVPAARRQLRADLARWGRSDLADEAELVLAELLANSIQHALPPGREVETRYYLERGGVRLEVQDGDGASRPRMRAAEEQGIGGRGLVLVDDLTRHRWGVRADRWAGKSVWALVGGEDGDP